MLGPKTYSQKEINIILSKLINDQNLLQVQANEINSKLKEIKDKIRYYKEFDLSQTKLF